MRIIQIPINNSLRNINYLITSSYNENALCFDPYDAQMIQDQLPANYKLETVILTHHHPDHIKDLPPLLDLGVQLLELKDQEVFTLSEREKIICYATPGHTMDHKVYLLSDDEKIHGMISGDLIFHGGVGHCKLGGDIDVLFDTIDKIVMTLDPEIIFYPSHDYFIANKEFCESWNVQTAFHTELEKRYRNGGFLTSLGEEKKYNPFFRYNEPALYESLKVNAGRDTFRLLRSYRDQW